MIRLIISDLDGTLLDDNGVLNPEFFDLLKELRKKDILFGVATGRQVPNVEKLFAPVLDDILLIGENGAYVEYQGKVLFNNPIKKPLVKDLIKCAKTIPDSAIFMCSKEVGYLDNTSDKMKKIGNFYGIISKYVENLNLVEDDILKFTVCSFTDAQTSALPVLKNKFSNVLEVEASGKVWTDVTDKNSNKGTAVRSVQEKLGFSFSNTLVIGDNDNDIKMMDTAFYSYAMKESSAGLKKAARFSTGSNSENSALKVIKSVLKGEIGN